MKKTLWLSQFNYYQKMLKCFNMKHANPALAPLRTSFRLSDIDPSSAEIEKEHMSKIPYASAIGSLMYKMVATQSDLAYVVGVTNCDMSNFGKKHWEAMKHIFR